MKERKECGGDDSEEKKKGGKDVGALNLFLSPEGKFCAYLCDEEQRVDLRVCFVGVPLMAI